MDPLATALAFAVVLGATAAATALVLGALRRRQILDHPNPRSSHVEPTPRGGGLAVVGVLAPAWAALAWVMPADSHDVWWILAAGLALAAVSWIDDLRGLAPLPRLAAQVAAVGVGAAALSAVGPVFQGLAPTWLDALLCGVVWLWYVTLFNFMDGIDGLAGAESASLGIGLFLIALFSGLSPQTGTLGLVAAAAALGFLAWNWHPARIFLGDVGSVPLGYLTGWLLLRAAAEGLWAPALILPLYYLADATLTLLRRLARRERIWSAHREHFYQRAAQRGLSHAAVVRIVLAGNVALVLCALAAARGWTWEALAGAGATVALVLVGLGRYRSR